MLTPDDSTVELKDPAAYETTPVMDLILQRVKALGAELAAVTARLEVVEAELRDIKRERTVTKSGTKRKAS